MTHRFPVTALRESAARLFEAGGVMPADAATIAEVLVHADLRGHGSHGVTRIPIYLERIQKGAVKAKPDIRIERKASALLWVDGDNGPGPVVSLKAVDAAIDVAREQGVCAAVVAHSNHNGAGSFYAERAAAAGCLLLGMTNAPPSMAVHGGRQSVIGTNPITFGSLPAGDVPVLADMATSVVARGKIVEGAKRGETIPEGWALDAEGKPTTDARAAEKGVVLPLSGAKGSALAVMVEILVGVLSGGRFAGSLGNLYSDFETPQDIGHFFLLLDVAALMPAADYQTRLSALVAELKASACADGFSEILMPGEIEARRAADLSASGIELPDNVIRDIDEAAKSVGIPGLLAETSATGFTTI